MLSNLPLRDPVTGRFLPSRPNKNIEILALANTMVYVVCFCSFMLMMAMAFLFVQTQRLRNVIIENRTLVEEINERGEGLVVIPELPEFEGPCVAPAEELKGGPDPVSDTEKPRSLIRVIRSGKVSYE